jgi:CDP-glucose 4,6-dehydratase
LLKLDISKAIWYLRWKPVLSFNEAVELTVDGYNDEMQSDDVYNKRVRQIYKYLEIGQKKNIEWIN